MPTWTISASKEFQESVKETAKKLGLGYSEYLRMAHKNQLKNLSSQDFDGATRLMDLDESKKKLNNLREIETILLREKAYKDKNVNKILRNIDDPKIKEKIQHIAEMREKEADKQLEIYTQMNITSADNYKREQKIQHYRELIQRLANSQYEESEEEKILSLLRNEGRSAKNAKEVLQILKEHAKDYGKSLFESYNYLTGESKNTAKENQNQNNDESKEGEFYG